jgi:hypothetical protein
LAATQGVAIGRRLLDQVQTQLARLVLLIDLFALLLQVHHHLGNHPDVNQLTLSQYHYLNSHKVDRYRQFHILLLLDPLQNVQYSLQINGIYQPVLPQQLFLHWH